ncbi:hypothetical protein SAMN02745244_02264 [Tessaracoccus bendigoensis DSM 12906]|uniref:Uncharacterized protein n=1 Tax=Tessaracoccus bendigoensis DSM 12906 TaxID=1123357 RepID=A0A1M6IFR6_9ACTN|nr:hypothetical protein SAMN02745244_02264 [Tessaracoccus bendigoensis DSM 12906]
MCFLTFRRQAQPITQVGLYLQSSLHARRPSRRTEAVQICRKRYRILQRGVPRAGSRAFCVGHIHQFHRGATSAAPPRHQRKGSTPAIHRRHQGYAVDTSLLTSIPAERLVTSDPAPIPAQRLVTSGIQLVTSDTAGVGHKPLVSTTITTTRQLDGRARPSQQSPSPAPPRHQPSDVDTSGRARHQRSGADTCAKARHQRSAPDTCAKARHQRYTAGDQQYCWYRPQTAGVHDHHHHPAARRTSAAGPTATQPGAAATPAF